MAAASATSPPENKASLADWLAVVAGTLGALMALMDVSIVNSSLPVIQGEIGATPAEATWVGTSYLIAEIIVIPLTAWLARMLGLRRLLLGAATLFTLFSVFCGLSSSLEMMIAGRIGQGLAGGVLIPSALTLVATRLPPGQQIIGLAFTGVSALLGPSMGPVLGGWLTENYGWNYAFFINVPVCALQAAMLLVGIAKTRGDWSEFKDADWFGIAGMVIGLGCLTTLLEEGHREQWFESALIWQLAFASLLGFAMIAYGQLRARRPVIRLSLLQSRELASASGLLMVLGMLIFTGVFLTPQFLVAIAGYNAFQAGSVAVIAGLVSLPVATLYPLLGKFLDLRVIVAGAIFSVCSGNFLLGGLTAASTGESFYISQLLYGMGTVLTAMPLQQAVISAVRPEDAAEANSISSIARNLGGSIGLAALSGFQDMRFDLHHWQLNGAISANDGAVQQQVAQASGMFGGGSEGQEAAMRMLDGQVMQQALVMTFSDMYLALSMAGLISIPLVLFLRPAKPGAALAMH